MLWIREWCETAACCVWCGELGTEWGTKRRVNIIGCACFFTILSVIFAIPPICALSKDIDTVRNVAWSHGEFSAFRNSSGNTYIGLSNVVLCIDDHCEAKDWSDADCDLTFDGSDVCDNCKAAAAGAISLSITSLVTQIPTFVTDIIRLDPATDSNCKKGMAVTTGITGFFLGMSTCIEFAYACHRQLDSDIVSYELGPSFICLIMVVWMKPVNSFLHFLVPTPEDLRFKELQASGEKPGYKSVTEHPTLSP